MPLDTSQRLEALARAVRPAPRFTVGDRVAVADKAPDLVWTVTEVRWHPAGCWRITAIALGMTASTNEARWRSATAADEAWRPKPMSRRQMHEARYDGWLPPYPTGAEGEVV